METRPLRAALLSAFSDDELRALCFDHFRPVYEQITVGMTKGQIVQLLLDYCSRRPGALAALVSVIERERPGLLGPDALAGVTPQPLAPRERWPRALAAVLVVAGIVALVLLRQSLGVSFQPSGAELQGGVPATNEPGSGIPAGTVLLHSTLDDASAIMTPGVGIGGRTSHTAGSFVAGYSGSAAPFVRGGDACDLPHSVTFPVRRGEQRNIDLGRGTLEFWYQPNYDALASDAQHILVSVSVDGYNPPFLQLDMSGQLTLTARERDNTDHAVRVDRLPLWLAGTWTHLRIVWDSQHPTDSLQIYVNEERLDAGGVAGGWSLEPAPEGMQIMVGGIAPCGQVLADGAIDELIIRQ
jgi:hypothetical protein